MEEFDITIAGVLLGWFITFSSGYIVNFLEYRRKVRCCIPILIVALRNDSFCLLKRPDYHPYTDNSIFNYNAQTLIEYVPNQTADYVEWVFKCDEHIRSKSLTLDWIKTETDILQNSLSEYTKKWTKPWPICLLEHWLELLKLK